MKDSISILFAFFFIANTVFSQVIIANIDITGLKRTKEQTITNLLSFKKSDLLDSTQVEQDIIFLKRLPLVSYAEYQVTYIKDSTCNLKINIKENFTILPELNFWETVGNQFSYRLGVYDYNFLGRNITVGGFYQNNGFDSYAFHINAPFLFSNKWGLSLSHQNWKSEEPLFFQNTVAHYLYQNISNEILALYQLNISHKFGLGINLFEETYDYLFGANNFTAPEKTLNKALLKFQYQLNTLNYFYQYVEGFRNELFIQYVVTENDFQNKFLIAWNDLSYFKRIQSTGNWASRIRVGLASNDNSPFSPFALDNNINIRGVGFLVDRGTGVVVLNTEYRHTWFENTSFAIQSNTFFDAGNWRSPGGLLNELVATDKLRLYTGLGLRLISKKIYNATFRIDYGIKLKDPNNTNFGGLVFGLGQYF